MWTYWWVWIVAGFVLGVLEIILPGYIFLGFAGGAVVTGVLVGLGVLGSNPYFLLLVFAIASLVTWLAVRRVMGVRSGQVKVWTDDINKN